MRQKGYWEEVRRMSDEKMRGVLERMSRENEVEGRWKIMKEGILKY
jgi:hypothetical protein